MRISYIRLENFAGIYGGTKKDFIEIEFPKDARRITLIQGINASGKSALLSQIHPFAYPPSIDERSTLNLIREGKDGYKEIHYIIEDHTFILKHYYKKSKSSYTVKSYIQLDGEELNENGNVTSFNQLIQIHFGLQQDMMRLLRLGSNVNSFISLTPARRKEYIGSLIDEIDMYLKAYKKVNDDIKVTKALLNTTIGSMYQLHVQDIVAEKSTLKDLYKSEKQISIDRDTLLQKLNSIRELEKKNNIDDLKLRKHELETSLFDISNTIDTVKKNQLEHVSVDDMIQKRAMKINKKIELQSQVNSLKLQIDHLYHQIEQMEISVKRVSSNQDIHSLEQALTSVQLQLNQIPDEIKKMSSGKISSGDLQGIISRLESANQIVQTLYGFGKEPMRIYLKLMGDGESIDLWLKKRVQEHSSSLNEKDIQQLLSQIYRDDMIITPNCAEEFVDCPYYRLHELIQTLEKKVNINIDPETLRYIQSIYQNMDRILDQIDLIKQSNLPDKLMDGLRVASIYKNLSLELPIFDLQPLRNYLSIIREHESYLQLTDHEKQIQLQIQSYQNSGVSGYQDMIASCRNDIQSHKDSIVRLQKQLDDMDEELRVIDSNIGILTKYQDALKYESTVRASLDDIDHVLLPLESATADKQMFEWEFQQKDQELNHLREEIKNQEMKIQRFKELSKEESGLKTKLDHLSIIQESVSTKKGIPVIYMKTYLGKIQETANRLLSIIYDDRFKLANFNVTQETFEIPYIKNGTKIPDVRYASQSEIPLATMALSFAISSRMSSKYNIILLDEMDAGFDEQNRQAFLQMLDTQIKMLHAEQVFIISHNINNIIDIPVDVIRMSNDIPLSKLQNIIYES